MPLEFALRPRFDLKRPAPRRRLRWLRLPPLALPIAVYWLGAGGVTHALIRWHAAEAPGAAAHPVRSGSSPGLDLAPSDAPAIADTRSSVDSWLASDDLARSRDLEPAPTQTSEPAPTPISEPEPTSEPAPAFTPTPTEPAPPAVAALATLPRAAASAPGPERVAQPAPRRTPAVELERRAAPPLAVEPLRPRDEIAAPAIADEPESAAPPAAGLPSCESAASAANQRIDIGAGRGAPDLTRDAFAAVLENGTYLRRCAIPARTALEICAAVQHGKVAGVSVTTAPHDPAIGACVRRAVASLRFPRNAQLDVTRTRFEPTR